MSISGEAVGRVFLPPFFRRMYMSAAPQQILLLSGSSQEKNMTRGTSAATVPLAFALICTPVAPAQASPITFAFTGSVSQDPLLDPADPFGGNIALGTIFSGSFVFESTTADGDPSGNGGSYTSLGGTLSLTIGGNAFAASDLLNIGVGNDFAGTDLFTVFAQRTSGPDPFDLSLSPRRDARTRSP